MALLETNVELRRNINLYNLFGGETQACWCVRLSNILQFKKKKKKNSLSEKQTASDPEQRGLKTKKHNVAKNFFILGQGGRLQCTI